MHIYHGEESQDWENEGTRGRREMSMFRMYDILVCKLIYMKPPYYINKYTIKIFYIKIYTDSSVRIC